MNTSSGLITLSPSKSNLKNEKIRLAAIRSNFKRIKSTLYFISLHFESQSHFGLYAAAEDLEHQLNERLFLDEALAVELAGKCVEPVADDARKVYVLSESNFVDSFTSITLRLC